MSVFLFIPALVTCLLLAEALAGPLLAAPAGVDAAVLPDGSVRFSASVTPDLTFRIDASTNLVDWTALTNIASPSGTIQLIDLNATNFSQRFYRAVLLETPLAAPGCVPPLSGLVGWWPGDGNANDIVGPDNGTLQGGATAAAVGEVGQAFNFDGTNSYVQIPDSPALRPTNLTIEAWVRFSSLDSAGSGGSPPGDQFLVFKQNSRTSDFEGFELSKTRVAVGDVFQFVVTSASAQVAEVRSATRITTGVWFHVAAVRGSNFTQIYVNGQLEGQTNVSSPQNYGTLPLYFGTSGQTYWDHKLKGSLDEVSLYNRALSATEIAAVYAAGAAGKCRVTIGATITAQPESLTVAVGGHALFTVVAGGTAPLSYQWRFNGANLSGATSTSLTLAGVQAANAGSYSVVVTNSAGLATSAAAVLTVTSASAWETAEIGAVWSDNFDRSALGANWTILGSANASIVSNQLQFVHVNTAASRQVYFQPWLTSSHQWTLRWSQRFGTSAGNVGVGLKNFQAEGGNDRGYNALLYGSGANVGKIAIERWDGTSQNLSALGPALTLAAGDVVDCSLTRSGWTMSATASNRVSGQVSTTSFAFSDAANLHAPTISRMCFYPFQGTVFVDNLSFVINYRKPARFIVIGASIAEGYDASTYAGGFVQVLQRNFTEAVCNDSSSWNGTGDAVSLLPEILAHQPGTAILTIGANDLTFGYPASHWQGNYANLVAQLQANGVKVKHCLPTPETTTDQRALKTWLLATYPASDVIDDWTSLVTNGYQLNPAYDNYDHDGVHPNDAGHLLIGQIIWEHLP